MRVIDLVGRGALVIVGAWVLIPRLLGAPERTVAVVEPYGVREPREFRAERSDEGTEDDALARKVHSVVERVVGEPELSPERQDELAAEILGALNVLGVGVPAQRAEAARETVEAIAEAARPFAGEHSSPSDLRRRAMRQQSAALTRTLVRRASGDAAPSSSFGPRPEGHRQLAWNELTDIEYAEGDALPASVLALDGENVALTGFLLDGGYEHEFLLVRSVWSCCFGKPPEIHEAVVVTVEGASDEAWFEEVVRVTGTLEVGEDWDDDYLLSVYRIRALRVDTLQR
ncbi:MAG: hypothetical protein AAGH15_05440 [Myxococcota bacterium]